MKERYQRLSYEERVNLFRTMDANHLSLEKRFKELEVAMLMIEAGRARAVAQHLQDIDPPNVPQEAQHKFVMQEDRWDIILWKLAKMIGDEHHVEFVKQFPFLNYLFPHVDMDQEMKNQMELEDLAGTGKLPEMDPRVKKKKITPTKS